MIGGLERARKALTLKIRHHLLAWPLARLRAPTHQYSEKLPALTSSQASRQDRGKEKVQGIGLAFLFHALLQSM